GLRQGAELLEAAGHAAEQLDLDGLGVPPTVDADDNAPGLARARRIRRREFRHRDVMRPDVRGLRGYSRAAVEGRGRELNGVVPICRIAVRRIGTNAGRPVAEGPRLRRETDSARVEGLVEKLNEIEGRGVERKESEVGDGRRCDFKVELQRTGLAEQATYLEIVGSVRPRT